MGLLDIDICGPSLPKMLGLEGQDIHSSGAGWSPVYVDDNLAVMSIGFMLPNKDDAVIWRGPRKNALIKQFLKVRPHAWEPPLSNNLSRSPLPQGTIGKGSALAKLSLPIAYPPACKTRANSCCCSDTLTLEDVVGLGFHGFSILTAVTRREAVQDSGKAEDHRAPDKGVEAQNTLP